MVHRRFPPANGAPLVSGIARRLFAAAGRPLAVMLVVILSLATGSPAIAAAVVDADQAQEWQEGQSLSFDSIASSAELTADHANVFRLYWAFFGRSPDPGGALYWIGQRDRCVALDVIADVFASSDEFIARNRQLSDRGFVELIYHNVLERPGDPPGLAYWTGLLTTGELTRGGVVLNVSLSSELTQRHPYPSDGVPPRSCHLADGRSTGRSVHLLDGQPLVTVGDLTILAPSAVIERAGFHQSTNRSAAALSQTQSSVVRMTTMTSRGRGTHARSAIDVVTEPGTIITAPVAGTVVRAGNYNLYCRYRDAYVVIAPDSHPHLEVKLLHIQQVRVTPGQRVQAGEPVAAHATVFPFRSQVDFLTAEPSWPHVHLEVIPSVPRGSSGSC